MLVGVVKEIKDRENRVALTPEGADTLVRSGHAVRFEQGAGTGSGFSDADYRSTGAEPVSREQAWDTELVLKVKEPLPSEYEFLHGQIVFTYFHLAGVPRSLTETLLDRKVTAVAYETLEDESGGLPLLAPMSAVAGNMAVTMGSYYLARFNQGKGMQLGSVLGDRYGKVVIIGDGVVGFHAAHTADGMGARVFIAGRHLRKEARLKQEISDRIDFFLSGPDAVARQLEDADLVVGAVLRRGEKAPHVVTEPMVKAMQPGSVIVDVSIDQGGCVETSRATTHTDPVFEKHGVIHYCVTNMPGAYPRTSTFALTSATLPYALKIADEGVDALLAEEGLARAVNTHNGDITCKAVAEALGMISSYHSFVHGEERRSGT